MPCPRISSKRKTNYKEGLFMYSEDGGEAVDGKVVSGRLYIF